MICFNGFILEYQIAFIGNAKFLFPYFDISIIFRQWCTMIFLCKIHFISCNFYISFEWYKKLSDLICYIFIYKCITDHSRMTTQLGRKCSKKDATKISRMIAYIYFLLPKLTKNLFEIDFEVPFTVCVEGITYPGTT